MANSLLEQARYEHPRGDEYRLRARSPGFPDDWLAAGEQLCAAFGEPPLERSFSECTFAYPFAKKHVAVVHVTIRGPSTETMIFHMLVMPLALYANRIGDPFQVVERFPTVWCAPGDLSALTWPDESPASRTVVEVQRVLQRTDGPLLLGAVQALVDGSRVVFVRPAPDAEFLRSLWTLLPTSLRGELWPASFTFASKLPFHAAIVPPGAADFEGYLNEEQAENYPEGRYELRLQIAAEDGDQSELDALFARRSPRQTLRLGLLLLALALALLLVSFLI